MTPNVFWIKFAKSSKTPVFLTTRTFNPVSDFATRKLVLKFRYEIELLSWLSRKLDFKFFESEIGFFSFWVENRYEKLWPPLLLSWPAGRNNKLVWEPQNSRFRQIISLCFSRVENTICQKTRIYNHFATKLFNLKICWAV